MYSSRSTIRWPASLVHRRLGEQAALSGADPTPEYKSAIADLDAVLAAGPQNPGALGNRGQVYECLAGYQALVGVDPRASYGHAADDLDAILKRNREDFLAWFDRSGVAFDLALWQIATGADGRPELERAVAAAEESLKRNPTFAAAAQRRDAVRARLSPTAAPWAADVEAAGRLVQAGDYAGANERYARALAQVKEAPADPAQRGLLANAHYNVACIEALAAAGKSAPNAAPVPVSAADRAAHVERALAELAAAIDLGFADRDHAQADADLEALRGEKRYQALLGRCGKR